MIGTEIMEAFLSTGYFSYITNLSLTQDTHISIAHKKPQQHNINLKVSGSNDLDKQVQ